MFLFMLQVWVIILECTIVVFSLSLLHVARVNVRRPVFLVTSSFFFPSPEMVHYPFALYSGRTRPNPLFLIQAKHRFSFFFPLPSQV